MKIFKDAKFLIEDHRVNDVFDYSSYQTHLERHLNTVEDKSIMALTGRYGSGKSRMLYSIAKADEGKKLWLFFDAWKYPDRKELWDGFVLDVAAQIGLKEQTLNIIDGKLTKGQTIAMGGIKSLYGVVDILAKIPVFKEVATSIFKAYEPAPVSRIFQLQEILVALLNSQKLPLRIVVEDIDRSGGNGVNFIETFSNFLRNNDIKPSVKVIVPMSPENYEAEKDSYQKSIDHQYTFNAQLSNVTEFVDTVLSPDLFDPKNVPNNAGGLDEAGLKQQLIEFLQVLIRSQLTPRQFKALCRDWAVNYKSYEQQGLNPDYRVVLLVQAGKYLANESGSNRSVFYEMQRQKRITQSSMLRAYCYLIQRPDIHMYRMNTEELQVPTLRVRFVDVQGAGSSIIIGTNNEMHQQEYFIPTFYLT